MLPAETSTFTKLLTLQSARRHRIGPIRRKSLRIKEAENMIRGMRQVISGATLVAGLLLQTAPAFAQAPPWAQQDRRRLIPAPQHAVRPAPQNAPQQQIRQPQAPQQQAQPQQPKAKPES